jgi:hypothetical protein
VPVGPLPAPPEIPAPARPTVRSGAHPKTQTSLVAAPASVPWRLIAFLVTLAIGAAAIYLLR